MSTNRMKKNTNVKWRKRMDSSQHEQERKKNRIDK